MKKELLFGIIVAICAAGIWAGNSGKTQAIQLGPRVDPPGPTVVRSSSRDVLSGLEGVHVLTWCQEGAESQGLTTEAIQRDVELRLRRHGIKVLTEEELLRMPGTPYLFVTVDFVGHATDRPTVGYIVEVSLKEAVLLSRDFDTIVVDAITYHNYYFGTVGSMNIRQIRESVKDPIDTFINDYLAANQSK